MTSARDHFKVGTRLAVLIKERGLKQTKFAVNAGLSEAMLSRIINNTKDVSVAQLKQIARALGIGIYDLIEPAATLAADPENNPKPLIIDGWRVPMTYLMAASMEKPLLVDFEYDHEFAQYPQSIKALQERKVGFLERKYAEENKLFFDGPNARLLGLGMSAYQNPDGSEVNLYKVRLGPVGWYEYTVLNQDIDERVFDPPLDTLRKRFASPQTVFDSPEDLSAIPLSNLITTMCVPITSDGFGMISRRGPFVTANPGALTPTITENIHRFKDDSAHAEHDLSVSSPKAEPSRPVEKNYRPRGYPSPILAIVRGMYEELSTEIYRRLRKQDVIRVLAITFDFQEFHPYFVATLELPWTASEVKDLIAEFPPIDNHEIAETKFLSLDWSDGEANKLMHDDLWGPGARAAFVCASKFYMHGVKTCKNTGRG